MQVAAHYNAPHVWALLSFYHMAVSNKPLPFSYRVRNVSRKQANLARYTAPQLNAMALRLAAKLKYKPCLRNAV